MTTKIDSRIELLQKRIAADTIELAELVQQKEAAAQLENIATGWSVSFKVGRADTRREVVGLVQGRGLVKDVDSVRVQVGEGLECELYTVAVTQLLSATDPAGSTVQGSEPQTEPSEIAVAMGTAAAGQSEADELLNDLVS